MPQNTLRELVKASNPVPNPAVLLREESDLRTLFEEVMHRADDPQASMYLLDDNVNWRSNMETKHEVIDLELTPEKNERKWWPTATLAAVAIAAIVLLVLAVQPDSPGEPVVTDDDSKVDVADQPSDAARGVSVTDAFFEAYNAGDVEAVDALFTPDVTIDWFGDVSRTDFEMITAFYAGQGTTLTPPDCNVIEEMPGESATVSCNFETLNSLIQTVSALPIRTKFDMVVTPDGVSQLLYTYGQVDFSNHPGRDPFRRWEEQNHPEAETTFGDWLTVDEARQHGQRVAQHTEEWAAYLEANGCTYLDETC